MLLTQGRAVGVHVVACFQDPRKEVLPFRDLFPTRIGAAADRSRPRSTWSSATAPATGARCATASPRDRSTPASATSSSTATPHPMRVRFSYLTDDDITDLAHQYGRLRVVDGDWTEGGAA